MGKFWNPMLLAAFTYSCASLDRSPKPDLATERTERTPDIKQSSKLLPGNGRTYCGPAAAANSLIWLSMQGFDKLSDHPCGESCQYDLIQLLGSSAYLDIDVENGTNDQNIVRGIRTYLSEKGYVAQEMEYRGWGKHDATAPSIEWIKQLLAGPTGALFRIGWYRASESPNNFVRLGGHWVTLVGVTKDAFIIHDPSSRQSEKDISISLNPIEKGALSRKKQTIPAKGFFKLGQSYRLKKGSDAAILEGVFFFRLEKQKLASISGE